jgi:hypothetical protein
MLQRKSLLLSVAREGAAVYDAPDIADSPAVVGAPATITDGVPLRTRGGSLRQGLPRLFQEHVFTWCLCLKTFQVVFLKHRSYYCRNPFVLAILRLLIALVSRKAAEGEWDSAAVLDLTVVNGKGGAEIAQELHEIDPHLLLIVSSGYTSGITRGFNSMKEFSTALDKPYTLSDVKRVFDQLAHH